ncbi:hypothetical protein Xen7305DRAFT_00011990 [Xenococcus sp. PCC 7305]|uniref:tellurite resistance TerB family protein n=1 Tax=Xenococcus sp. PCC 7305 TaxID=102125 RepID=UPI0002ACF05E|nr:TerB family tellurite resistance protein [Xenococcus sp. PCC 7305]ELS01495.1 hypothetical protein Xen7305DRAFT_00011990 [Xenococcus sp. PCC 7305]
MAIAQETKNKKLFKILIGTAWIDGVMQPEERIYLRRIAQEFQLSEDPEIKILLSELKIVNPPECYLWLEEYLEEYPGAENYHELLERVSGIIYGNGDVDIRETRILEKIQSFDPRDKSQNWILERMLRRIRKFYQKVVQERIYN